MPRHLCLRRQINISVLSLCGGKAKEEKECPLVLEEIAESLLLSLIVGDSCLLPEAKVHLKEREWVSVQTRLGSVKASYQVVVNVAQQSWSPPQGRERLLISEPCFGIWHQVYSISSNYPSLLTARISLFGMADELFSLN